MRRFRFRFSKDLWQTKVFCFELNRQGGCKRMIPEFYGTAEQLSEFSLFPPIIRFVVEELMKELATNACHGVLEEWELQVEAATKVSVGFDRIWAAPGVAESGIALIRAVKKCRAQREHQRRAWESSPMGKHYGPMPFYG